MKTRKYYRFIIIMAMLLALITVVSGSAANVTVVENQATFEALPGYGKIEIPAVTVRICILASIHGI